MASCGSSSAGPPPTGDGVPVAATAGRWTSTTATQLRAARKSTRSTGMQVQRRSVRRRAPAPIPPGATGARRRARWPGRPGKRSGPGPAAGALSWAQLPHGRDGAGFTRSVLDPAHGCQVETFTCGPMAAGSAALSGQRQQRVEQRVGAPLDRLPVAHLVGPVAAPAPRGDEEHARVGHRRPGSGRRGPRPTACACSGA